MESDETKSIQQPQLPTLHQIDSKAPTIDIGVSPLPQAKVTGQQVDKMFYQAYPDLLKQRWRERVNKPLADTSIDRALRQEWCAVANKLIEQSSTK
jgi:hypothetical protein